MKVTRHLRLSDRRPWQWWLLGVLTAVLVIALIGGIMHFTSNDKEKSASRDPAQELAERTNWSKVYTDDFSGETLDPKRWNHYYPWGARTNTANGEHQWYQSSNVAVADGHLVITAKRQSKALVRDVGNNKKQQFQYTSGLITSYGKMQADVGGVDVRAKAKPGPALWPAIWLLPTKGYPPEFDVFETFGQSPTIHQTAHYADETKKDALVDTVDPSDGFHTYSARWDHDRVVYLVDGKVTLTVPRTDASSPLYLLINMAVGSSFLGAPSQQTPNTSQFQIDSVVFMVGDA